MMSTAAKKPETTPIPVQLSEPEFTEFIFPHLSMPKRGPRCKLGYHRLFNLILWVLYTGMPWKCLPIPKGHTGKSDIHYTNVYRAFARWADDGSLQQAFIASVAHLSDEKKLDVRILHGDGTNTVAKKGETGLVTRVTNTRRARRSSPSRTTMAMCCLHSRWLPSMQRTWFCCRRGSKP
jgi:transposase